VQWGAEAQSFDGAAEPADIQRIMHRVAGGGVRGLELEDPL